MMTLLDDYDLRKLTGPTATLIATGAGWQYEDQPRVYSLTLSTDPMSAALLIGRIEGWDGAGRHACVIGSLQMQATRAELAAALGGERFTVMRDLFRMEKAIRVLGIRAGLLSGLEDEAAVRCPRLHAWISGDDREELDLIACGLDGRSRRRIAKQIRRLGGRVLARRAK